VSSSGGSYFPTTLPIGTIGDLLAGCTSMLDAEGLPEPDREAREIVAAVLNVPKFWAAANAVADASPQVARSVIRAAMKRASGAPLAYAVGRASFRHLTLEVDERVLIPRVETELLVERVLERATATTRAIADIGTGSGAIALSLAFEGEFARVFATDISLDAIDVAAANAQSLAKSLKSPVHFRHGSLLAPLAGEKLEAIVCNPPYVSFAEIGDLPAMSATGSLLSRCSVHRTDCRSHVRLSAKRLRCSRRVDFLRSRSMPAGREPWQR